MEGEAVVMLLDGSGWGEGDGCGGLRPPRCSPSTPSAPPHTHTACLRSFFLPFARSLSVARNTRGRPQPLPPSP